MSDEEEDGMPVVDFDEGLDIIEFEATSFGIEDVALLRPALGDRRPETRRLAPPKPRRE